MRVRLSTKSDEGSIFIETLVATAIVAAMLGALFGILRDSNSDTRAANDRIRAAQVGESVLAGLGSVIPLGVGSTSGVEGDFTWQVTMAPYESSSVPSAAGRLLRVDVIVRRQNQQTSLLNLHSLRTAKGI